jgi:hypothetical protein
MKHLLATASALAMLIGLATAPASSEEKTAWRLFVSDHAASVVHALDMETGKTIETFDVKAPTSLYRSDSGRSIFAVQGKGDVISVLSSGIAFGDHGDHGDIKVEAPRLLDVAFEGKKPSHFVDHDGDIALFFDGEGKARVTREADILDGKPAIREVVTDAPHHGVAIALGDDVLISEPNTDKPTSCRQAFVSSIAPVRPSAISMPAPTCMAKHPRATWWPLPAPKGFLSPQATARSSFCLMTRPCPRANRRLWSAAAACNISSAIMAQVLSC